MNTRQKIRSLAAGMTLGLMMVSVVACGTLEIGLEPTVVTVPEGEFISETVTVQAHETPETASATPEVASPAVETAIPTPSAEVTTSAEPIATVMPAAASPIVGYIKEDNLWLWSQADGSRQLTSDGGVERVHVSDDGQQAAFVRDGDIWVVDSDGANERRLTSEADFAEIDFGAGFGFPILGMAPYQIAWLPGRPLLLFNTTPQIEGPGLLLSDDLWLIDVSTGSVSNLLPPGEGGQFLLSPDASLLALTTPGTISVARSDGSNKVELLTYAPVLTYSELAYYAQPTWTPASDALWVTIPPADRLAQPDQLTSVWHLSADGLATRLMGNLTQANSLAGSPLIAPSGERIAYLTGDMQGLLQVAVAEIGEAGVQAPSIYPPAGEMVNSWAPDSQRFVFTPPSGGTPSRHVGAIGQDPVVIGDASNAVFDVSWLDDTRVLYLQSDGASGWMIVLGDLAGGSPTTIAAVSGAPPAYDVVMVAR